MMREMEARAYLESLTNYEQLPAREGLRARRIERMQQLLAALGHPERRLRLIHVAGTKGKGSVCAMIYSVLRQAGQPVGLYTSPHLVNFRERIQLAAGPRQPDLETSDWISEASLADGVARLRAAVDAAPAAEGPVTYFEALTAVALDYFARAGARWVVLETGLGGRLDATNATQPEVAVLTPISLDHTDVLGTTIAAIAEEKAGIIKAGQIVISAAQPPEAAAVIRRRCAVVQATLVMAGEQFGVSAAHVNRQGATCTVRGRLATYPEVRLLLLGRHQVDNAAAACAVIEAVTERDSALALSADALRVGLTQVEWPGRGEWLPGTPPLLLDGAHNGASAETLRALLDDVFPGQRVGVIFGTSSDKDVEGMVAALRPRVTTWWATQASHPRALAADALAQRLRAAGVTATAVPSLREAFTVAQRSDCTLLVVTGSLFVVGEARALLTEAPVS